MFTKVEAPTTNISNKRQFDDNEYKEVQNDVKFPKYDYSAYKPNNTYYNDVDEQAIYDDEDEQEYYRG